MSRPGLGLVVVIVLVAAAAVLLVRHFNRSGGAEQVPVRCESCGHEFVPARGETDPVCPECGSSAKLRLLYFRCEDCGLTFVAYEQDSPGGVIREPGGEWMPIAECDFQPICPDCGSARTVFIRTPEGEAPGPAPE